MTNPEPQFDLAAAIEEAAEPPMVHQSPPQFFTDYLSVVFARDLSRDDVHWCEHWKEHPEAAVAIDALWRSWEHLTRDQATGLAVWLVQFAYPLMSHLMVDAGTFAACAEGAHNPPPPLPEI